MSALGEQHYQAAVQAYERRDFHAAAAEFRAAYDLTHVAALLFNLGNALAADSQRDAAVEAFRAYLRELPDAPNRADIEARLRALGDLGPAAAPPPPRVEAPREPPPRIEQAPARVATPPLRISERSPVSVAGGVVGAVGVVAAAVGVGLYVDALGVYESCQRSACALEDQRRGEYQASLGLLVGGSVLAVGGLVTMLAAPRRERVVERGPYVLVQPGGLVVGGAF